MATFFIMLGMGLVWVILVTVVVQIMNTHRARNGQNINDDFTTFFVGVTLGPFAILGAFSPHQRYRGSLIFGGVVGLILFLLVYDSFFPL